MFIFFLRYGETTPTTAICINEYLGISANQSTHYKEISKEYMGQLLAFLGDALHKSRFSQHVFSTSCSISTAFISLTFTFIPI